MVKTRTAQTGADDGYVPSPRRIERERFKRARARRATAVAALSTLVTGAVLFLVITRSPGWPRTRETFFSLEYARMALPKVLDGLLLNLRLLVVCGAAVLVLGLLLAVARTLRGPVFFPLRALAAAYTDFFRGLPLIICLLMVVFGVPALRLQGVTTDPVLLGGSALVLTYSAYVAEVFRAGIESVHPSQRAAARSLGLSGGQALRFVVLPQAVRRVVPPLLNDLVSLQKDTGLVSIAGAVDAVYAAQIIAGKDFNFTPYVVAGLVFVALTIPMTRCTDWITARMDRRRAQGGLV
ncbi:amino acid ABC transporter permease [Streptomyces sp. Je 1-4]|uniref:amino acid ABC transporter permease n=1 Tax=unclassified Streptomyces TaxID=2593676 RepID=UPI00140ED0F7|nr:MULTISPECIES: amino acid ABC transporter permease [unclassified Streptomyces]QIK11701.1 amino acid ABC transporter permease [Streptomyces sp. ID38640]UYB45024.1 amino acid ABC transporter permease [Streptomyces sp. Je 1-4]UZQ40028.1 amino acid ABC transporter permease [Streptomyces sp. Je 1-4] [Streptomyces sp. Je 1-4 4N24]UZQ47445.1 amino acid ABC transporter permease [Streptomyces sp. Je 1-4] [Streptomyces sp. Je 1-4 4N24_ara]